MVSRCFNATCGRFVDPSSPKKRVEKGLITNSSSVVYFGRGTLPDPPPKRAGLFKMEGWPILLHNPYRKATTKGPAPLRNRLTPPRKGFQGLLGDLVGITCVAATSAPLRQGDPHRVLQEPLRGEDCLPTSGLGGFEGTLFRGLEENLLGFRGKLWRVLVVEWGSKENWLGFTGNYGNLVCLGSPILTHSHS